MGALVASDVQSTATKIRTALVRLGLECPHANVVSLDLAADGMAQRPIDLAFVVMRPDAGRAAATLSRRVLRHQHIPSP